MSPLADIDLVFKRLCEYEFVYLGQIFLFVLNTRICICPQKMTLHALVVNHFLHPNVFRLCNELATFSGIISRNII